jgi:DNA helicase II / ATP-dependent DNA helicase PcrA
MAVQRATRWGAPGPWWVRERRVWTPFPAARARWHVTLTSRLHRVPSAEAALATARAALARDGRSRTRAIHTELAVLDRAMRCVWRGTDEASVRAAARAAAGWIGAPPAPAAPPVERPRRALTDAQRRVVEHPGGPALVVAVAGAGKTTTMVERVRALVRSGVAPQRVLVVSFSRAAVADVRAKLLAADRASLGEVEVRTFHALAHVVLREAADGGPVPTPGPPPEQVSERLLDLVVQGWRRDAHPLASELDELDREAFLDYRGRCLAHLALPDPDTRGLPGAARRLVRHPPADPEQPLHAPLLHAHEALRRERGWRDYDDLVVDAWVALMRDAPLLERVQRRFTHRIVDECQDVNPAQVAFLEALVGDTREVMLVGDDDQSIYGFRGSDPALMHQLADRLAARRYVLDHTFRTRPEPLAAAADLVEHLPGRLPKRVRSARSRGGRLTLDVAAGTAEEAALVAARLAGARRDGVAWHEQAVLVRRFAQTVPIEHALLTAGVPYRLTGAPDLFDHPTCRAALAGLHLVSVAGAPRAHRARAWRRWLTGLGVPAGRAAERAAHWSGLGDGSAQAVERLVGRNSGGDAAALAAAKRLAAAAGAGVVAGLRAAAAELLPWPQRGADAARLRALAAVVDAGVFGAVAHDATAFLAALARTTTARVRAGSRVTLTSAHRSKGLEWDVVVVPGQDLGVFPVSDDAEERRLAYVAWTRARERLHLVRDAERPPSPFLAEAGIDALATLQDDLAWCAAGVGRDSLAATWARAEARRRFGVDISGTRGPRDDRHFGPTLVVLEARGGA